MYQPMMTYNEHYRNIRKASSLVSKAISECDLSLKEFKLLNSKLSFLIENLNYWSAYGNKFRYYYDLKHFTLWVLKTFSEEGN